ncbi:MAG: hypothetical protein WCO79_02835 [bacterium]
MSKIGNVAAVGLLVAAGYSLSLGSEGRAQLAAASMVVVDSGSSILASARDFTGEFSEAVQHLSFANVYAIVGELSGIASPDKQTSEGLVVAEKTDGLADANQEEKIRSSFSDKVIIHQDASKKSGTITPVFRGEEGDKYMYVMVPVKK